MAKKKKKKRVSITPNSSNNDDKERVSSATENEDNNNARKDLLYVQWQQPKNTFTNNNNNNNLLRLPRDSRRRLHVGVSPRDAQQLRVHTNTRGRRHDKVLLCSLLSSSSPPPTTTTTTSTTPNRNMNINVTNTDKDDDGSSKQLSIRIAAMAVATVHVVNNNGMSHNTKSPRNNMMIRSTSPQSKKQSGLSPGTIQLSSASVRDILMLADAPIAAPHDDHTNRDTTPTTTTTIASTATTPTKMAAETIVSATPPPPKPPITTTIAKTPPAQKTPSSSSTPGSGFSFKQHLSSIITTTSPATPSSSSAAKKRRQGDDDTNGTRQRLAMVPLDSRFGYRLRQQLRLETAATRLVVTPITTTTAVGDYNSEHHHHHHDVDDHNNKEYVGGVKSSSLSSPVIQCLIRAYHDGEYVQCGQILTISYQGHSLDLQIVQVNGDEEAAADAEHDDDDNNVNNNHNNNNNNNNNSGHDNPKSLQNDPDADNKSNATPDETILLWNAALRFQPRPRQRLYQISRRSTFVRVVVMDDNNNDPISIRQRKQTTQSGAEEEEALLMTSMKSLSLQATTNDHGDENSQRNAPSDKQQQQQQHPSRLVVGLDTVVDQVQSVIDSAFTTASTNTSRRTQHNNNSQKIIKPPRGLLLHGPSGVGKTALAKQIAQHFASLSNNNNSKNNSVSVQYVNCVSIAAQASIVGQAERTLERYFSKNKNNERHRSGRQTNRLLVLDDIHLICPKRGGPGSWGLATDQIASTLLALIDGAESSLNGDDAKCSANTNLFILATTSNASLLDAALRRPGRLDVEVEVPIPDSAACRGEILQFHVHRLSNQAGKTSPITVNPKLTSDEWEQLGKQAKGFNGADCLLAIKEAAQSVAIRERKLSHGNDDGDSAAPLTLTKQDFIRAIQSIRPSAIQSITVEIPKVLWSDIGGMDTVKSELREAIEAPMTHADLYAKFKIPPPRGILLYGPPGCSKTLMARALATEGQMNFLAVKGPELLSKWLGESERALASLFRRARMASPAIIFFDEIDAIASERDGSDNSSSSRLLSQLLTELDGITSATSNNPNQRVVVVAATNRPDLLDKALTRPGRIDRKIYVGVPDKESRMKIFDIALAGRACSGDIDLKALSDDGTTQGFSGAECVAICRDAALLALEEAEDDDPEADVVIQNRHLVFAAKQATRQITTEMVNFYYSYGGESQSSE